MNGTTHVAVGAALGVVYVTVPAHLWTNTLVDRPDTLTAQLVLIVACMLGSLFPDIDHARSLISQRVGPVGWLVRLFASHRGITHTILFMSLVCLGLMMIHHQLGAWFGIGYLSHIVLDMLTPAGVRLFYPLYSISSVLAPRRVLGVLKPALELGLLLWSIVMIGGKLWGI